MNNNQTRAVDNKETLFMNYSIAQFLISLSLTLPPGKSRKSLKI